MDKFDEVIKLKEEINNFRAAITQKSKEVIKSISKEFFDKYPELCVSWVQYTPYFNDGDECVFRVNDITINFDTDKPDLELLLQNENKEFCDKYSDNNKVIWTGDQILGYDSNIKLKNIRPQIAKDIKTLADQLYKLLDNQLAKDVFGDHVWVKLNKDGITVDPYEHE